MPEVALVPDHAPEAEQDVALVEDQSSIEVPPLVTDVGVAANDTVGRIVAPPVGARGSTPPAPPQPVRPRDASRVAKNTTTKILDPTFLALDICEVLRINLQERIETYKTNTQFTCHSSKGPRNRGLRRVG